jgi:hypothetical protein
MWKKVLSVFAGSFEMNVPRVCTMSVKNLGEALGLTIVTTIFSMLLALYYFHIYSTEKKAQRGQN